MGGEVQLQREGVNDDDQEKKKGRSAHYNYYREGMSESGEKKGNAARDGGARGTTGELSEASDALRRYTRLEQPA